SCWTAAASSQTDPHAKFWSSHDCPHSSAALCNSPSAMAITTSGRWLYQHLHHRTNPQFSVLNYLANMGNNNYHSLQTEFSLRPTHGFSGTANYTWNRNLGIPATPPSAFGGFGAMITNPVDRHMDYTIVNGNHSHILRTNGNIDLPMGPGKLLFRNTSGVLARVTGAWRLGFIYTVSSGPWASIT